MIKITWIGHSCFKIQKGDFTIVIDPYEDGSVPGLSPVRESADMVLCTHDHFDHNAVQNVELSSGGVCPFEIIELEVFHDDEQGALRGTTKIFILDDGDYSIAHLGDLGSELTDEIKQELYGVDYLLIPVGGTYTIGPREAALLTLEADAHYTIPMHYRGIETGFGFDELAPVYDYVAFLKGVWILSKSEITTRDMISGKVVVLQPQNVSSGEL